MRILVLHNEVMEYRKPVFNKLASKHDVTVVHSGPPSVNSSDRYRERLIPCNKFGPFYFQSRIQTVVSETPTDIIIAMFDLRWPSLLAAAFRRRDARVVLWGHRYSSRSIPNLIRDMILKKADAILLYGDEEVQRMVDRGIDSRKIHIAWNTIHVANAFDSSQDEKTSFIFVGRLQARKRLTDVIKSFREVAKISPDLRLEIVGSGPEYHLLSELVSRYDLSAQVKFHGKVIADEQLRPIFSRAIAYVSPGPVGLGVLHSFAYGVPVITYASGRHGPEFHNLKDKINSLILAGPDELEDALIMLGQNRNQARRLGHAAYLHYSEKRSLDGMISGFERAMEGD